MIRLVSYTPGGINDATNWYRGHGPLGEMARSFPDRFLLHDQTEWNWVTLGHYHGAFLQRPFADDHAAGIRIAKRCGAFIWVDYDDDLFRVPRDNPVAANYMNPFVQHNLREICKNADLITVATEKLVSVFKEFAAGRVEYVPNAASPLAFYQTMLKAEAPREKVVVWRGSNTHDRDLMGVHFTLLEAAAKYPDWKFVFLGHHPWWLMDTATENMVFQAGTSLLDYHSVLADLKPAVCIVPLADTEFNRAKSHIAWIEGTLAGASCVLPEFRSFERPGFRYVSQPLGRGTQNNTFRDALYQAIDEPEEREESVRQSLSLIDEQFKLRDTAERRLQILEEMIVL